MSPAPFPPKRSGRPLWSWYAYRRRAELVSRRGGPYYSMRNSRRWRRALWRLGFGVKPKRVPGWDRSNHR